LQWGGKLESANKRCVPRSRLRRLEAQSPRPSADSATSDRRMELLYAQNYSQTSAKKTCARCRCPLLLPPPTTVQVVLQSL
jgi:hypothetical protein